MENIKIPKIIHYCWFGGKPKPDSVKKCIDSWEKNLHGYKFIEWNEKNYDYNKKAYTKQAYEKKKYAFVSDVARIEALEKFGGIYLDTDVEVLKSFDDILNKGDCILGFEEENYIATSFIASIPRHNLINQFTEIYNSIEFLDKYGKIIPGTNVAKLTNMLEGLGLKRNNKKQYLIDDIVVYPKEYFSPYDYANCYYNITEKTYCIHHFYVSWMPWRVHLKKLIKKIVVRLIGVNNFKKIKNMLR